ncbi:MAG: twin-arginine translocase TatA/TatE family subunit [Deltaproteobacteria bacterium]|nr:twin-arginine translocase TatA/TatE family subunit [Deltaproteobacteria bacterium]
MFGLGVPELIVIAIIVLILFGTKRLPEIGKGLGSAIREFRNIKKEIVSSPSEELSEKKDEAKTKAPDKLEEGIKKQV